MIRRWSCINYINIDLKKYKKFDKFSHLILFKSAVYFKRFLIKKTKFKRKSLARWKHRTNWVVYLNILKYWARDYKFCKQLTRYQFFKKFFLTTVVAYNFNYIRAQTAKNFSIHSILYTNAVSKTLYNYFDKKNFTISDVYMTNLNKLEAYIPVEGLDKVSNIIPVYSFYENLYYSPTAKDDFNFFEISNFLFTTYIKNLTEIYKILTLLFYFLLKR